MSSKSCTSKEEILKMMNAYWLLQYRRKYHAYIAEAIRNKLKFSLIK